MKALIVDDDRILADLLAFTMRREGFEVIQAHNAENAILLWEENHPDIILLDVNLPGYRDLRDGFSLCERIRQCEETPIILVTVRGAEEDILRGLQAGADDYISKPFSPRQLVARAYAVLRRADKPLRQAVFQFGDLILDPGRREVHVGSDKRFPLTTLEYRLLETLMLNGGKVLSVLELIDHLWGPGKGSREMLRQIVHRLRIKIEPDPEQPVYLLTMPGMGYGLGGSQGG